MTQKTGFDLLKEKVPEFRNPLKMAVVVAVGLLIFLGIMTFFWWLDGLVRYGALISQLIVALIFSAFSYGHIKFAGKYREKYGRLAYRYFFFHFVMPMLVIGNACLFHPLLVEGPALLPVWLAIVLGASLLTMRFLLEWHIHRSGFDEVGHGLTIYMVFPEEGRRVSSEVYSYIRHPMYAGDLCMASGFAVLRNNPLAVLTAMISFIPFLVELRLEDKELIERFGEEQRRYVEEVPAIIPRFRNLCKFLKFLFFTEKK